jgi:hypothetical protein
MAYLPPAGLVTKREKGKGPFLLISISNAVKVPGKV